MSELTEKQRELLVAAMDYIYKNGYAPTLRELLANTSYKTMAGVHRGLQILEENKLIERRPTKERLASRAIKIL